MQDKKTLIDKASEICGGDAALARRMGISRALVSLMRSGDRKITPETAAELADIAGDDAREAAISALLENAKGTRRESVLREILGKALAAGVAGMLVFFYSGDSISATEKIANKLDSLYIVSSRVLWRRVLQQIWRIVNAWCWHASRNTCFSSVEGGTGGAGLTPHGRPRADAGAPWRHGHSTAPGDTGRARL